MKVAFIQRDAYEKIGVQQLSGCLKKSMLRVISS